jgi:hypothetical protein
MERHMKSWLSILVMTLGIASCGRQETNLGGGKNPSGVESRGDDGAPSPDNLRSPPDQDQSPVPPSPDPSQTAKTTPIGGAQKTDLNQPKVDKMEVQSLANLRLLNFYTKKPNYDQVYKEVLSFYPAGRSNGCVAFLSSALRLTQTFIPRDKTINGYNVSLVTIAFSDYLSKTLNWKIIKDVNLLLPGDVVMTLPPKEYPGIPAHTYMFQSWKDRKKGIGMVVDNQDFSHERNIFGSGTYNFTPFWYALRSPTQSPKSIASAQ